MTETAVSRPTPKEAVQSEENPVYTNSTLLDKLYLQVQQGRRAQIYFFDLDGTLEAQDKTISPTVSEQERTLLEKQGIPVVFVTSRTPEMTMSKAVYEATKARGEIDRPEPHLGKDANGKMVAEDPATLVAYKGLLDPDVTATETGAIIHVRQKDGSYMQDRYYEKKLHIAAEWRAQTFPYMQRLVATVNHQLFEKGITGASIALEGIEDEAAYAQGRADVAPLDRRIQINIKAAEASSGTGGTGATAGGNDVAEDQMQPVKKAKALLKEQIKILAKEQGLRVDMIDDSNPAKGRASLYLVPSEVSKQRATREVVKAVEKQLGKKIQKTYFGDSFTDLLAAQGLVDTAAAEGERMGTIVLTGDSRLTNYLLEGIKAGQEDEEKVAQHMASAHLFFEDEERLRSLEDAYGTRTDFAGEGISSLTRRFSEVKDSDGNTVVGEYDFQPPLSKGLIRVVLGAEKYPGTAMGDTVLAYTKDALAA
jgi:hydroxymethylpyrimidine pyrophosphatase-like HAD family hydrolase